MPATALTIACLIRDQQLLDSCRRWLGAKALRLEPLDLGRDPVDQLRHRRTGFDDGLDGGFEDGFDGLLIERGGLDRRHSQALRESGLLMPAVVIGEVSGDIDYHPTELHLPQDQLEQLPYIMDAAISGFLRQGVGAGPAAASSGLDQLAAHDQEAEHWKPVSRLQGRLGYLGVFYKRDPARFLRKLSEQERNHLLGSLERTYRDLLLSYFRDPAAANQALESFVNTAFFCDLPVTKAVEIHINMIDNFDKQLKLEGHKSDFLQDYRLALIDVMAHLCEMYRRSLPPDLPMSPSLARLSAAKIDAAAKADTAVTA
jgi:circadian clock protein KaiA